MAGDEAFHPAEEKIEEARRSGATQLNLSGNYCAKDSEKLTELPEALGQLTRLQKLNLSRNQLTSLPESLGRLTQLETLNLSRNHLTSLPESLGQLGQLRALHLSDNQLTTLGESLGRLANLQTLNLDGNQLTSLPESLGQLTVLQNLHLSYNQLTALPESLGQLTHLQTLNLSYNQLTSLPESLGQLTRLQTLTVECSKLKSLPESVGQLVQLKELNLHDSELLSLPVSLANLTRLETLVLNGSSLVLESESNSLGRMKQLRNLDISGINSWSLPTYLSHLVQLRSLSVSNNQLTAIPEWIGDLAQLTVLYATDNKIERLPDSIGNLTKLTTLNLGGSHGSFHWIWGEDEGHGNKLTSLPSRIVELSELSELNLDDNPLNPELAAAYEQGLDAVKEYLRAKAEASVVLNEAKLILIGEGEVGKSCLLDALRDEPWQKHVSTHGIEIKPVPVTHRDDDGAETNITLNTWDFGGQKVYRPTHQLFFSAPAVYLVVWKPREGPQQGAVEYWINAIKHRAGPDAKVLVVATHGGPQQRQPDIDQQDLRDKFGADTILGFFHVDNRPPNYDEATDTWSGERKGIAGLKDAIADVAAALPNVGREVAASWSNVLATVRKRSEKDPYITYKQFQSLCRPKKVSHELAKTYAGMLNELGYVIHYGADDDLKEIMILKPDWLAKAISFVLDDEQTRARHGLVSHEHLTQLWSHPPYEGEEGYPNDVHSLFRRLMERFDLSYEVVIDPASNKPIATSLIAQLVDDQSLLLPDWGESPQEGDEEKRQVCQIVEKDKDRSANAEGLFYRLIARLHKYSLGRDDFDKSVHWQRGLMLEDRYNGRAVLRHVGNDVHITVRAAYPDFLLYELTKEVKWLVEHPDEGWAGLRCDVMVPCIEPCGLKQPGRGMFEVGKLKESKRRGRDEYPCDAAGCDEWQDINCLLQNSTITRKSGLSEAEVESVRQTLTSVVRTELKAKDKKDLHRFRSLRSGARFI